MEHSIAIVDVLPGNEFCYIGWNPATEERIGISARSIAGKTPEELLGDANGAIVRQNYLRCLNAGTTIRYEEHLPIEGQDFWWLTTVNPLKDGTGQIYRLVITAIPITDRKHAEIALQRSEQRFRLLVQNTSQIIWDTEAEGKFTTEQPAWSAFTGQSFEQSRNWGWLDAIHPDDQWHTATAWSSALTNVRHYKVEHRLRRHDGEYRYMSVQAIPILASDGSITEWIGVNIDIHDRKLAEAALRRSEAELRQQAADLENALRELQQMQAQLVQTEKMSSLGQLVAGIAHEINNPVNFIHGNLSYVGEYTQNLLNLIALYQHHCPALPQIQAAADAIDLDFIQQDLPKMLASMRMGTDRIRTIVLALRTFSRMDESGKKRVNLHEGIDSTLLILQHRLKQTNDRPEIIVVKDYGDLPPIDCYAGQLNQVFMNILSNAIDALDDPALRSSDPQRPPSQITIQTKRTDQHVQICICDNAMGMSEYTRSRLFEPFFTTKAIGKGTGLGLSISYQVVARHGGKLSCVSASEEGSAFFLELPIA
ncbi:MAG: PAS domain S-box protein [Leptolyngbyaceae cyanobacterium SM1_3_5]|nr:PAS domain S-box protein [Leptolyngbyaceae cyanobacterium SM1_3_5]